MSVAIAGFLLTSCIQAAMMPEASWTAQVPRARQIEFENQVAGIADRNALSIEARHDAPLGRGYVAYLDGDQAFVTITSPGQADEHHIGVYRKAAGASLDALNTDIEGSLQSFDLVKVE